MRGELVDEEAGGHSVEAEAERLIQELGTVNTPGTGGSLPATASADRVSALS